MIVMSDLRQRPEYLDLVADRIWHAWWQDSEMDLAAFRTFVARGLGQAPIPSVFVALDGERFAGTASIVEVDLDIRSHYRPWVAAVWVEEVARGRGIGRALVGAAAGAIFGAGFPRAYLYTGAHRVSFYTGFGWQPIETNVGEKRVTILVLDAPEIPQA